MLDALPAADFPIVIKKIKTSFFFFLVGYNYFLILRIISISTGILKGNECTPIATRECFPTSSPKTSTIKSEAPLITYGCSVKMIEIRFIPVGALCYLNGVYFHHFKRYPYGLSN